MHWYIAVLKKYAVFSGRARRKEFWIFSLLNIVFLCAIVLIENAVFSTFYLAILYVLGTMLPNLAVGVRRLHDAGFSGWWILLNFFALTSLILLVFWLLKGEKGENKYGTDPREQQEDLSSIEL